MYIDILDDIVSKCNNTYHSRIKMKPVNVKSSTYIGSSKEINDRGPKFKIGDIVRISKYKSFFFLFFLKKAMLPIGLKKFLCLKKLKTLCREHMSLVNLKTTTKFLERLQKRIAKNKLKRV